MKVAQHSAEQVPGADLVAAVPVARPQSARVEGGGHVSGPLQAAAAVSLVVAHYSVIEFN